MNTYNYITSRCLTPANASRRSFPAEILNVVLNKDTGELLEMHHLLINPKYKDVWGKSYTTELGRLAQGIPGVSKGTNTIVFTTLDKIPMDRRKNITYGHICANYCPKKDRPKSLTAHRWRRQTQRTRRLWNTHRRHGHRQTSPQQRHLNQGCTLLHHRPQRFLPHDTNVTPRIHAHENQESP